MLAKMDLTAVAILALLLQKVGSIDTMTFASGTPSTPPPGLMDTSGDSDDASSMESSLDTLDSLGATAAAATWYMSFFHVEALVRLAFIRWRLFAISPGQRQGRQARGRATR